MNNVCDVIFFYPSKNIGGAQLLFSRLANKLSENKNIRVVVVDFIDGFLRGNVNSDVLCIEKKELIDLPKSNNKFVICPLSMISSIHKEMKDISIQRYIYWCIHPENTIDILKGGFKYKNNEFLIHCFNFMKIREIKKSLLDGIENNNIFFMDETNLKRTSSFYGITVNNPKYLPIPVLPFNTTNCIDRNINNIVWIGRLSKDKVFSLIYALEKMNKIRSKEKINIHIIGDGQYIGLIDSSKYNNLDIIHHGFVANESIKEFIIFNHIGLAIGMGTSILETSLYGIPSLLIDPSYNYISEDYSPQWVYEIKNYTLGTFEHQFKEKSFYEYFDEYKNDSDNIIGYKCKLYVEKNHSMDIIAEKITNELLM